MGTILFIMTKETIYIIYNIYKFHGSLDLRSSGSTFRTKSNPMGRKDSTAVRDGNILACRCFILLLVASCRGAWWVMEQPSSSSMEHMPMFQHLVRLLGIQRLKMCMADFGAPTIKRTLLYSSTFGVQATCFLQLFDLKMMKDLGY